MVFPPTALPLLVLSGNSSCEPSSQSCLLLLAYALSFIQNGHKHWTYITTGYHIIFQPHWILWPKSCCIRIQCHCAETVGAMGQEEDISNCQIYFLSAHNMVNRQQKLFSSLSCRYNSHSRVSVVVCLHVIFRAWKVLKTILLHYLSMARIALHIYMCVTPLAQLSAMNCYEVHQ